MDPMASRPSSFPAIPAISITSADRGRRTGRSILRKAGRSLSNDTRFGDNERRQQQEEIVRNVIGRPWLVGGMLGIILLGIMVPPALSHHSFAMYDQTVTKVMTGKLTRYIPGANHAQLIFHVLDNDGNPVMKNGKPLQWGVETGSAIAMARNGVSPATFPEGTIFTVELYPLRDGRDFGAMAGLLINCGTTMPKGGCTRETGKVLTDRTFNAR